MNTIMDFLGKATHSVVSSVKFETAQFLFHAPARSQVAADILVLDASGSMGNDDYLPSRFAGAEQAAARFLERRLATDPDGLVGVVGFADSAWLVCGSLPLRTGCSELKSRLRNMTIAGGTNTSTGLELAQKELLKITAAKELRILLLTDGYSTDGDPVSTARRIKEAGIQLDIIGIGGTPREVNEAQLKRMASVVDGELRYWFIKSVGELIQKFGTLALREIK